MKAKTSNSSQSAQAKTKKASTPKRADVTVKLYFDANYVCLGGSADDLWIPSYSGEYFYSNYARLPYGFDFIDKKESYFLVKLRDYTLAKKLANQSGNTLFD